MDQLSGNTAMPENTDDSQNLQNQEGTPPPAPSIEDMIRKTQESVTKVFKTNQQITEENRKLRQETEGLRKIVQEKLDSFEKKSNDPIVDDDLSKILTKFANETSEKTVAKFKEGFAETTSQKTLEALMLNMKMYQKAEQEKEWQRTHSDVDIDDLREFGLDKGISPDHPDFLKTAYAAYKESVKIQSPTQTAMPLRSSKVSQPPLITVTEVLNKMKYNPSIYDSLAPEMKAEVNRILGGALQ